jgi:Helix-turn-helix domain/Family of unknown function (DUF5937)
MVTLRLGPEDVAGLRFAISPLMELHNSVRALEHPEAQALHLPWAAATRTRVADIDLALLQALHPRKAYTPDFVDPPPRSPLEELEDEIERMLATPPERVRFELRRAYDGRAMPAVLEPLLRDPARELPALADLFRAYWERALAPHWPRIRALLEGDILHRARRLADGGAAALFSDIHPEVSFAEGTLRIDMPFEVSADLGGRGMVFVPSAFTWPRPAVSVEPPYAPFLVYPARGVGGLWEPERAAAPEALAALVGARRASILSALHAPRSTTELARALELSAGSVSQHLSVLRDAGLVRGHRVGRAVLYVRSEKGETLVG